MGSTHDVSAGNTALHRNPFAILRANLTDTRAEINSLAEDRAFVLQENVVQEARRILTNPRARIGAEVGWLPGLDAEVISRVVTPEGISSSVTIPSSVLALTRANVAAAWLEAQPTRDGNNDRTRDQLTVLFQLDNQIDLEQTREVLNTARQVAGMSEIERIDLAGAIRAQRSYYLDVCRGALGHLDRSQLAPLLVQFQRTDVCNGDLLRSLVDDYALANDEALQEIAASVNQRIRTIRRFPKSSDLDKRLLTEAVIQYGEISQPVLIGLESVGTFHAGITELFTEVRSLAVDLANDHDEFDSALAITKALQGAFGDVSRFRDVLVRDIDALTEIISQRDASLEAPKTSSPISSRSQANSSTHRWPQEVSAQRSHSNSTGTGNRSAGFLLTILAGIFLLLRGIWNWTSGLLKVVIVFAVIGMVWNAVSSDSDGQSTSSRCDGIGEWWDATDVRWNALMGYVDTVNYYNNVDRSTLRSMQEVIREQRTSGAPSAAKEYNNAIVAYMEFVYDSVLGSTASDYAWRTEKDRLFNNLQKKEQAAASMCGITLT